MSRKAWHIASYNKEQVKELARQTGFDEFTVLLLATRNILDPEEIRSFLSGEVKLDDPFAIKDMSRAVAAIRAAVEDDEQITVYGDYDADGVTATALLYSYLQTMGARVDKYIPSRIDEGYGLHRESIDLLAQRGTQLIITVDNGIGSIAEADYIREKGIKLVVTDHHKVGPTLPNALAVVNPHRSDDNSSFKELAGVGVAFKLCAALEDGDQETLLDEYAELVTLGTIADIVPLTGENRSLVIRGLEKINRAPSPGVAALIESAGIAGKTLASAGVSFSLAPRVNAAGRMGTAGTALELLLTEDETQASMLAEELEACNAQRQETESEIAASAIHTIETDPALRNASVIIVAGRGWHPGVIGIVASRLTDRYARPCIVVSVDENGVGSGSCRSIEGFSMYDALAVNSDLLLRFGGHMLAAGFSIREADIPTFRERINRYADGLPPFRPELTLDCRLNPASVSMDLIEAFRALEPFGANNRQPLFGLFGMTVQAVKPLGPTGRHLRLTVERKGAALHAVMFGMSVEDFPFEAGDRIDLAVNLDINEFRGERSLQILVRAVRPAGADDDAYFAANRLLLRIRRGETLTEAERAQACPDRTLCANVFRLVKSRSVCPADDEAMALKLGLTSADSVRVAIALTAFCELGIMECVDDRYHICVSEGKKKLADAPVLQKLGYQEV